MSVDYDCGCDVSSFSSRRERREVFSEVSSREKELRDELRDLESSKDDGLLLMGIPGLNFLGLMDMEDKEERINEIKKELGEE